jgi:chitodextrinase
MGDSPQGIIPSLTLSQIDSYLANRKNYGFNTLWINLLARHQTGGPDDGATVEGDIPFTDYLAGQTGNPEYYNLDARNPAYFNKAKEVIRKAADQDMLVILDPIETMDFLGVLQHNGQQNAYEYGQYLGDTFQEFDNIIWMHGNDFNTYMNDTDRMLVRKVGEGIRDRDNLNSLQTVLGYASPSEAMDLVYDPNPDDTAWAPLINLDTVYTYGPSYEYVAPEYVRAASYSDGTYSRGRIPVYLAETYYDFEEMVPGRSNRPTKEFRWQQYWAILSGAAGHTYGNYDSVYLDGDWAPKLDTPAAANFSRWNQFFTSYAWYELQPDQSLLTAGDDGGDWNRATASITANGSLAMVYIPNARNVTVNMSRFSGTVHAQWFNPVSGTYTPDGTFTNSGTHQFTPPAGNHLETNWYGGTETSNDWVLVLQLAAPDNEAPSVPTNLSAVAISSSQINLAWTASTDNVGVIGYKVYRDGLLVNGNVTGTTFSDAGLTANTTHMYTLTAFDAMNNTSAQSAAASATTQSPPPPDTVPPTAPTNLVAGGATSTQIPLSWTPSTDDAAVAGYHVFRCQGTSCANFAQITSNLVLATNYTDTGLTAGTTYRYKVIAVDGANNVSDDSNLISATTQTLPSVSAFLMAAWNFNEGAGTTAADFTANGNTATLSGTTWTAGKYGGGLSFGGTSSHLSIANSSSLNISGSEMTISLWMNPLAPSNSDTVVIGKFWNTSWTDPYYQYGLEMASGNRPALVIGTTSGYRSAVMSSAVPYGQWTHVSVTFNGTQVKFYINGVLTDTQSLVGIITARNNSMNIGADQSNSQGFKGVLDDIRIYNKVLSQTEVAGDMSALQ